MGFKTFGAGNDGGLWRDRSGGLRIEGNQANDMHKIQHIERRR